MDNPNNLKFRVWNTRLKEFRNGAAILPCGAIISIDSNRAYFKTDEAIVQRFTGLKDKLNRDVYEGDILSAKYEKYDDIVFTRHYEILWIQDTLDFNSGEYATLYTGFGAKLIKTSCNLPSETDFHVPGEIVGIGNEFKFTNYGTNGDLVVTRTEIIGNIFENPQLLNEQS